MIKIEDIIQVAVGICAAGMVSGVGLALLFLASSPRPAGVAGSTRRNNRRVEPRA